MEDMDVVKIIRKGGDVAVTKKLAKPKPKTKAKTNTKNKGKK